MPPRIEIRPTVTLSPEHENALTLAVRTLPDAWRVVVRGETTMGPAALFSVRILGPGFTTMATFSPDAKPEQIAAFVETIKREHGDLG
jgi:hypothetical protein